LKKFGNSIAPVGAGRRSAEPKSLKTLVKSTQNRTKHRNLAQAIQAARAL
jgi:hypothetical protein